MRYRKNIINHIVAGVLLVVSASVANAQDLQLWYDRPADKWVEALPIGNGRIGAMVFGGIQQDRIQFNEETLWTGYPRDYNKKGAYKYLDSIRGLLFEGKQKQAETLAEAEFMGLKSFSGDRAAWVKKVTRILKQKNNPSVENYNDTHWKSLNVPNFDGWEAEGLEGLDGAVWLRRHFELPKYWKGKDLVLDLNKISEWDYTFVNGEQVGEQKNTEARNYRLPSTVLKPGKNTIAILVLNFTGKGGIMGYKGNSKPIGLYPKDGDVSEIISLQGQWKYFIQNTDVPAVGQYQGAYQPFGDLNFNFEIDESRVDQYKRSLDLANALSVTSYNYQGVHYTREYIVSAADQVLGIHFSADKKSAISFSAEMSSPHRESLIKKIDGQTISLQVKVKDGALKGVAYLSIHIEGGTVSVHDNKIIVTQANSATAWLTANTNYKNYKEVSAVPALLAAASLNQLKNKNWQQVKRAHTEEYQKYFNTFSLSFGAGKNGFQTPLPTDRRLQQFVSHHDPSFVALYVQYGRYLLISSSRPGTRPANLQGIWNDLLSPPWGSKYTTNINLEMNYWPSDILNMPAMQQPLFQMLRELAITGSETAKEYYKAPGWVLHHNTDLWRGTAPINASNHGIWVTGGAWLCDHLWQHYLFTQSLGFLKDTAYPIMKSAALFFNSFLVKDPKTGYLVSSPSNSPEQGGLVAGPTMDHQIIRNLFKSTIEASALLQTDEALRKELQDKYGKIAPNQIGRYGQLQEWVQDVDDTTNKHRHVSHLWGVYPGSEINWKQTPELMKAARQSLLYRGDEATGWSLGWKINLWARFLDGDHTYKLIQMLLSPAKGGAGSYPNLLDAHPPFQIDGNFGGAAGVGEMLLQSHAGVIELLPALPTALPEGEVKGIRARGGFVLDITWDENNLTSVDIKSEAGLPLLIHYKGKEVKLPTTKGKIYHFDGSLNQL